MRVPVEALAGAKWKKSSKSGGAQQCVEIAWSSDLAAIRDTKDRDGGVLAFEQAAFGAFIGAIKAKAADYPA
jgi:hypothetical protein